MTPLSIEKAREIVKDFEKREVALFGIGTEAKGFIEGFESREAEIKALERKAEAYRQVAIDAEARRISDDWPDREHTEEATKSVDAEAARILESLPK